MCQRNIGKTNRDRSFDIKYNTKVEKILKGSLDLIQSPSLSVKIQIMSGKVYLRCRGKILLAMLGAVNKILKTKSLLSSPSNVLPYCLKMTWVSKNKTFHCLFTKISTDGVMALFYNFWSIFNKKISQNNQSNKNSDIFKYFKAVSCLKFINQGPKESQVCTLD